MLHAHTFRFDEEPHLYYIDDRPVPSVTGILNRAFGDPYAAVPQASRDYALCLGREVHKWTALNDLKLLPHEPSTEAMQGYLAAWRRFLRERVQEVVDVERQVFSIKNMFGGTLDRLLILNDPTLGSKTFRTIVDIKTGQTLHPYAELQTAGYWIAWEEMNYPKRIEKRMSVLVHADGSYHPLYYTEKTDRRVFLAALTCIGWKSRKNLKIEVEAA